MSIDETIDNQDRAIMREALSSYSRQERITLRRFIGTLLVHEVMREERILRLILNLLDEGRAKRQGGKFRVVEDVGDGDG